MDSTNKKILGYLTEKDKASESAAINETFKALGVSKEEYSRRLRSLQAKGYIRYEHPFGNGAFIYITENGRFAMRPFLQRTREYLTGHFLEIIILIIGIITVWIGWQTLNLQQTTTQQENFPFFQYDYNNGIFRVTGGSRVEITNVNWFFPSKRFKESGPWDLRKVGNHPTSLGYYELRDYFAGEMNVNTLIKAGEDAVVCNLYLFSDNGIPALVSVTYDKNDKQGITSNDFVLITKLDTSIPEVIVQASGRHVEDKEVPGLFNEHMPLFNSAMDIMNEQKDRACGLIYNQPKEGYADPGTPEPLQLLR